MSMEIPGIISTALLRRNDSHVGSKHLSSSGNFFSPVFRLSRRFEKGGREGGRRKREIRWNFPLMCSRAHAPETRYSGDVSRRSREVLRYFDVSRTPCILLTEDKVCAVRKIDDFCLNVYGKRIAMKYSAPIIPSVCMYNTRCTRQEKPRNNRETSSSTSFSCRTIVHPLSLFSFSDIHTYARARTVTHIHTYTVNGRTLIFPAEKL